MKPQLTLGELIDKLDTMPQDHEVRYDFAYFAPHDVDSYRGDYSELALGYEAERTITVEEVRKMCRRALHFTFQGYKGGMYTMRESTPVWVANYGEATYTAVVDVMDIGYMAIIETGHRG